jgi:hypothetical protein
MARTLESASAGSVPVLDDPLAPELFVDAVIGAYLSNGAVRLTLVSRRCDYAKKPPEFTDVVIGRLTMPVGAAKNLQEFLGRFAEHMDEQHTSSGELAVKVLQ